jgi:hypothetical protein
VAGQSLDLARTGNGRSAAAAPNKEGAPRSPATGEAGDWGAQDELNHPGSPAQQVAFGQIRDRRIVQQIGQIRHFHCDGYHSPQKTSVPCTGLKDDAIHIRPLRPDQPPQPDSNHGRIQLRVRPRQQGVNQASPQVLDRRPDVWDGTDSGLVVAQAATNLARGPTGGKAG